MLGHLMTSEHLNLLKEFDYLKNKKSFWKETRKAIGFKSLLLNYWDIAQIV